MAIEGTLDDFRLTDILQMVGQQQKTGILTIQGESTIVAVSFLAGRVVGADSLEETVEERLGELLVREGMLSREEFSRVVEEQREGKGRLVDLLVDRGYLDRDQVLQSLHRQTTELLGRLVEWEHGEFKFYANDEVAHEEGFRPIAVDELLLSLLPEEPEEAEPSGGAGAEPERLAEVVPLSKGPGAEAPGAWERDEAAGPEEALSPIPEGDGGGPDWQEVSWSGEELGAEETGGTAGAAEAAESAPPAAPAAGAGAPATTSAEATVRPAEAPRAAPVPAPKARPEVRGRVARWTVAALALLLAATLVAALLRSPGSFLLPLPWQQGELRAYQAVQRQVRFQGIDSAAKTFFLKEVRFPESLDRLVDLFLLAPEETVGPEGRELVIVPREDSYELRVAGEGTEAATLEAITGDFLLDPDFLSASETDRSPPLVLLD